MKKFIGLLCAIVFSLMGFGACGGAETKTATGIEIDASFLTDPVVVKNQAFPAEFRMKVLYADSSAGESVAVKPEMLTGFDAGKSGRQTVNILLEGVTAPVEILVADALVEPSSSIVTAIANLGDGAVVAVKGGSYGEKLTVASSLTFYGYRGGAVKQEAGVEVTADNVSFENFTFDQTGLEGNSDKAYLRITGEDFSMENCIVERTSADSYIAQGWLVEYAAESGTFAAKDCEFRALIRDEDVREMKSLVGVPYATVEIENCKFMTNGTAIAATGQSESGNFGIVKGAIKNSVFSGYLGKNPRNIVNSQYFDGLVFEGCTFADNTNTPLVVGGNFTLGNCDFGFTGESDECVYFLTSDGTAVIRNNVIRLGGNVNGIDLTCFETADYSRITIEGNEFVGTGKNAIVYRGTAELFTNNVLNGNTNKNDSAS